MRYFVVLAAFLLQAAPTAIPQEIASDQHTISVNVDLVNVPFTVADRNGKLVTSLSQERLRVFEDNQRQVISNFSRESDLPLTIALLIDTSGSVRDKVRFEQEAAIEFFRSMLRRGKDKGLLITFDSVVDLLQDFTDDSEVLARAAGRIRVGGGTSLYDAVFLATTEKLVGQPGRKIVILISDGDDNSSRTSITQALEAAQKNDAAIYGISTNSILKHSSQDAKRGDAALRRLADETGGRVFFPSTTSELTANFQGIREEIRSQYSLAYVPANAIRDGRFRGIRIETTDRNLRVRARSGYYAPDGK